MLPNPLGQPDHDQALAAALRVPDDAAFAPPHERLRRPHAEILVVPAKLLHPGVEHDEVMDQLQKPRLAAKLQQRRVQQILGSAGGHVRFGFLPRQVILLLCLNRPVTQTLRVVAGQDELDRGKEPLDENLLLVVEILADALGHGDGRAFQLQHAERDAVDVDDHVGAFRVRLGIGGGHRDFLGDGEIVVLGVLPIHQPDGNVVLAHVRFHLHAVAQHFIHDPVAVIQGLAGIARGLFHFVKRLADERVGVPLRFEPGTQ